MNYKMVFSVLGKTMLIEAALLIAPILVGFYYGEQAANAYFYLAYLIPIAGLTVIGVPLSCIRSKDKNIYAKEGFLIVAFSWLILSLVGAVPFVVSGEIPSYIDALFETASGFTTTGASIIDKPDVTGLLLSRSAMFWRVLTHFIGGMGVLVFVLALIPSGNSGIMHIFRAESPGPDSSKIVGRIKSTARILYGIYVALAATETILLIIGGMDVYDAMLNSFSTAGTGGFGLYNGSIAAYGNSYYEIVIAVFMFLFGINFNLYYLILTGNILKAIKSEEFIVYICIIVGATITISLNILSLCANFGEALRLSFFQVASISSTTGFTTADFNAWPTLAKAILLMITVVGASGGSTGGGMKVARLCILFKSAVARVKRLINPRSVVSVKFEGKPLEKDVESNVITYFILYIGIVFFVTLLLSFDGFAAGDPFTHLSATLACISNVGPGFNMVGPTCSFAGYSAFSKLLLSMVMIAGRLEIFPIIILFSTHTWKRG